MSLILIIRSLNIGATPVFIKKRAVFGNDGCASSPEKEKINFTERINMCLQLGVSNDRRFLPLLDDLRQRTLHVLDDFVFKYATSLPSFASKGGELGSS